MPGEYELPARLEHGAELICWWPFCKQMHGVRMRPLGLHNGTDFEHTAPVHDASRSPIATLAASSSSLMPHDVMGRA